MSNTPMRVAIIISSLHSGGAERVASTMANYWVRKGREVRILTLSGADDIPFYDLDPAVQHVPLGLAWVSPNHLAGLVSGARRVLAIRRVLGKLRPTVVISFMESTNLLALMATRGLGMPVVVSVRNDPVRAKLDMARRWMRGPLYARADAVVVQTERTKALFPPAVQSRCHVIPNPVLVSNGTSGEAGGPTLARPVVVAMGRLTEQKGFDLLLEAFSRLRDRFPEWRLVIIGEGPLRSRLEVQAAELAIQDRVELLGRVKHPERALQQADLFVLSSRFEGFPNALCEAMACGLPVVSFDCPSGPREIIRDRLDGLLVPPEDVGALAQAMAGLMASEDERNRLAARSPEVVERFAVERVMGSWDKLLKAVLDANLGSAEQSSPRARGQN